ncbi:MAG: DUF3237 family protein [Acidimicrobiia bacterium]
MSQSATPADTVSDVQVLGDKLYEGHFAVTSVVEYGGSLQMVATGAAAVPLCGLRVDVGFEGPVSGRIDGTMRGTDHIQIRADGRIELNVRGELTTHDGAKIAVEVGGVAVRQPTGRSLLRQHAKLTTADPAYVWVNALEIWATGIVDLAAGTIDVAAYLPRGEETMTEGVVL